MVNNNNLAGIRKDYTLNTFDENNVLADPVDQFRKWFSEALQEGVNEPNAMTLATVNDEGKPSARIVLLKGIKENNFVFYTNYHSKKGKQLEANPYAALVFFWPELQRQVRIEGRVEKGTTQDADDYFNSRPIESRLGAIASPQSEVLISRGELEDVYNALKKQYDKSTVKRPVHWGGFILVPQNIEFWQGRASRLHDRILFTRLKEGWDKVRLAP